MRAAALGRGAVRRAATALVALPLLAGGFVATSTSAGASATPFGYNSFLAQDVHQGGGCPPLPPDVPRMTAPVMSEGTDCTGSGISMRSQSAMAASSGGTTTVYYGGSRSDFAVNPGVFGDTWVWDGSAWTPICGTTVPGATAACGPGPRASHSMGPNPDGPGVVLYGGSVDGGPPGQADTWVFDGTTWAPVCGTAVAGHDQPCGPGTRWGATMVGHGDQLLLFGGFANGDLVNDTWSFSGSTWTEVNDGTGTAPDARALGAAAWDGHEFTLFGGAERGSPPPSGSDYTVSDAPLQANTFGANASELSYLGVDYTNTGPAGGANGVLFIAEGTDYAGITADGQPVTVPGSAGFSNYDVALVDFGGVNQTTAYIAAAAMTGNSESRDCTGAVALFALTAHTVTCANYEQNVLSQNGADADYTDNGLNTFESGAPGDVTLVGGSSAPAITASSTTVYDHVLPGLGGRGTGAYWLTSGDPQTPQFVTADDTRLDTFSDASSPVDVALIVDGTDHGTMYINPADAALSSRDCAGVVALETGTGITCEGYEQGVFTPSGDGHSYDPNPLTSFTPSLAAASAGSAPALAYAAQPPGGLALLADTWNWDGSAWQPKCGTAVSGATQACGPAARYSAGFAFLQATPSSSSALLVGGATSPNPGDQSTWLGDMWQWDGATWTQLTSQWTSPSTNTDTDGSVDAHPAPFAPVLASRPGACTVTLAGTIELGESHNQVARGSGGADIGLDANGDGRPDGCDGPPIPPGPHPFVANAPTFVPQPNMGGAGTAPRFGSAFATMPGGNNAVLYGGEHLFGGEILSDTWTFNGEAWTPNCGTTEPGATGDCSPGARLGHAMGTAPNGVLLYGGVRSGGLGPPLDGQSGLAPVQSDAWFWDGSSWAQVCSSCAPGPLVGATAAGNGRQMLLFGGVSSQGNQSNATWSFDGTNFTEVDAGGPDAPSARAFASMSWDGTQFVLFGGADATELGSTGPGASKADTWVWTGTAWRRVCDTTCGPPARSFAGFSRLPAPAGANADQATAAAGALLFGGADWESTQPVPDASFDLLGDTWFWTGTSWERLVSPFPDRMTPAQLAWNLGGTQTPWFGVTATIQSRCEVALALGVADPNTDPPSFKSQTYLMGFDNSSDSGGKPTCVGATSGGGPPSNPVSGILPVTGAVVLPELLLALGLLGVGTTMLARRRQRDPAAPSGAPPSG